MIRKIIDGIFKTVEIIIFILFAILSVLIFFQVFNRFVTNNSLTWSEEICRYLMIWTVFLASAVVYREGRHMRVDNLVNALKGVPLHIINTVSMIFQIAFIFMLFWGAYTLYPILIGQESPANHVNMAIPYTAIPTCATLMCIAIIEKYVLKEAPKEDKDEGVIQL